MAATGQGRKIGELQNSGSIIQTNPDGSIVVISSGGGMTNPMTTTGDIIYGGAGGAPQRRAIGTAGDLLTVSGGVPIWAHDFPAALYTFDQGVTVTGHLTAGSLEVVGGLEVDTNLIIDTHITDNNGSTGADGDVLQQAGGKVVWAADPGGGGGTTPLLEQIIDYIAANPTTPIDTLITSGSYRVFIFVKSDNTNGWTDATNAVYTVAMGKTLYPIIGMSTGITENTANSDYANRQARFRNTTDGVDLFAPTNGFANSGFFLGMWAPDTNPATWPSAAAGKTVKLGLWDNGAVTRTMGAIVIAKEV
jgi:hypothetical protein